LDRALATGVLLLFRPVEAGFAPREAASSFALTRLRDLQQAPEARGIGAG